MTARRAFLQWLGAAPVATMTPRIALAATAGAAASARAADLGRGHVRLQDERISLQFDERMRSRVVRVDGARPQALTGFDAGEQLVIAEPTAAAAGAAVATLGAEAAPLPVPMKSRTLDRFALVSAVPSSGVTPFGAGQGLTMVGQAAGAAVEKTVKVTLLDEHPGVALIEVAFVNRSDKPLAVHGWTVASHRLLASPRHAGGWWTYSGATHTDRRDWMQPLKRGFEQRNFFGMDSSDYGGGTPLVDVWRRDVGVAVGHLDTLPRLVSLAVKAVGDQVDIALRGDVARTLAPGESLVLPLAFVAVHDGDCFVPLDRYRRLMNAQGLVAPEPPRDAHDAVWCAWGYERDFSLDRVRATLPKAQELGLKWAVLDDGWQRATGDWFDIDLAKFPRGEEDMKALVADIHARGMKARLWIAPLAVAPGSDELHAHTDLLLLDKDGAPQAITWWNCFYLCPGAKGTQERTAAMFRKIIGEWGFDGLKIDGQHLNAVAPCFNPKHRHAKPEDSYERMAEFYRVMWESAHAVNPEAVVEVCPCGTSYAFHNMPWIDQAPASDPLSSWQVRHKGKALKAQMGRWSAYAGDHVELSTGGMDFASSVGVGAVVSTKFTWPEDPKPKDSFLLTPERETHWRRWISAHNAKGLSDGTCRGELYDIAFDKPETHVVEKNGVMHYAFYAPSWDGAVTLRGLGPGVWRIRDYVNGVDLGRVDAAKPMLKVAFKEHLLIEAVLEGTSPLPMARVARLPTRLRGRDRFPLASAWEDAPSIFFAHDWRGQPLRGTQSTRVQMLHGDGMLHLRFLSRYNALHVYDREVSPTAIWPLWERDVVEVFLQAPQDVGTRRYREIEVSPNGFVMDLEVDGQGRKRLIDACQARVSRDERHRMWTAELSIPLPALASKRREALEGWRINLFRIEGNKETRQFSSWSPTNTPVANFHVPEAFGHLVF
ncbi:MAG: alpha-galactosidase [Mitsuaria chitosanitabida]|uniref:alpha-galactosidase n=1 Tax=Roseateles chitosanitabidus TaxID=65048 RepID=UPI001B058659|nr:alpha-galactosidase [Roseateles chitosanitabidus]MBO9689120.1 alpha-galactosidase [Roseateles chitosanitabidus]